MNILVVAATRLEISPLIAWLAIPEQKDLHRITGQAGKHTVDLLVTGIGMTHAAYHLGKTLAEKKYDLAINAGIAGTYGNTAEPGMVVHVTSDRISELGVEQGEQLLTFYETGLMDPDEFPYRSGILVNGYRPDLEALRSLPSVSGNTVNRIRTSPQWLARLANEFPADIETMEGAAFFYGCLSEKIPCLQIRSVSNHVKDRDPSEWNIPLAVENLNSVLIQILKELCT
jgi:futalosine hydrolase